MLLSKQKQQQKLFIYTEFIKHRLWLSDISPVLHGASVEKLVEKLAFPNESLATGHTSQVQQKAYV